MSKFSSQDPIQFPLPFSLPGDSCFNNFVPTNNEEIIQALKDPEQNLVFIWGQNHVGKSHLLFATFHEFLQQHESAYFLQLEYKDNLALEMLENLEHQRLLCVDDIHLIAGNSDWENAMFHLFNRFKETGNKLIFSANANAENISFQLADLKSRLQWGLTYEVEELADDDKILVLQKRANEKQLALSYDVASYLLTRVSRDMQYLIELLDKLDYASLAEQRKLTIPFVKKYI